MRAVYRPATPYDAGAVGAILSGFIDDTPWMPRIHTRAEDLAHMGSLIDRGWVEVAEVDQAVVGFLARENDDIHALYLAPSHQGRALGKALLDRAKAASAHLKLWCFQSNTGAARFYQREGFDDVQRTDGSGNDERLPDIEFHWHRKVAS